jgi:hypothetical protein
LSWLAVADAGVVDYRIEGSELIDLIGNVSCLSNAGEVPDHYFLCVGKFSLSLIRPLLVSSMQYNTVALLNQELRGHEA